MTKGEETKRAIVGEALDLVSTLGLEKLTIGTLANATGMSTSGLFAHFKSKEQLQLQVLEEARRRYVETVARPSFKKPPGELRADLDVEQFVFELGSANTGFHHYGRLVGDPNAAKQARRMVDGIIERAQ